MPDLHSSACGCHHLQNFKYSKTTCAYLSAQIHLLCTCPGLLCGYQLLLHRSTHEKGWQQGWQHALAAGQMFALPQLGPELLAPNPAPVTLLLCPAAKVCVINANRGLMLKEYHGQRATYCTFMVSTSIVVYVYVPASKRIDCV